MGLFSFIANAGKKIFGRDQPEAEAGQPVKQLNVDQLTVLRQHVHSLGLKINNLDVRLDGPGEITLFGQAASRADFEKAALMAGNVVGITKVNNQITIAHPPEVTQKEEPESATYTVEKGDSLWKIAERHYGNGSKYNVIFEANQPMIKDPDEIYPGQVLRIPKID